MQPEPSRQKKDRHMASIRRDARHKIIRQMRNELYFETQPISKISELFHLAPKQFGDYSIMEILSYRYDQLLNVSQILAQIGQEMGEENGVSAHTAFWAFLAQQLFTEQLLPNNQLLVFFSEFLKKNSYRKLSADKLLQTKILNTLQLSLIPAQVPKQFRIECLKWVAGTEGITLIYNSLINQFLCPNEYENVYETIIEGCKTHNIEKITESCEIVKCIMKSADYDDTYRIYSEKGELMIALLQALNSLADSLEIDRLVDAVIYLLDSYDSLIFDYARMGVGLLAVHLIRSKIQANVLKGLEIIKFITEIAQQAPTVYLLEDRELKEAGLWYTIFGTDLISKSKNISIKRQCYAILSNIACNGDRKILSKLNNICVSYQHQTFLEFVCEKLKIEEDITNLNCILTILSTFIYYCGNNFTQEDQECPQPTNANHQTKQQQAILFQQTIRKMIELSADIQIRKLTLHRSTEVAENAHKIYESIQFLLKEGI